MPVVEISRSTISSRSLATPSGFVASSALDKFDCGMRSVIYLFSFPRADTPFRVGAAFDARGLRLIARQERNNGPAMPPAFAACPSITKRGGRINTAIRSICRIAWQADDSYPLSGNTEMGNRSIKKKLLTCSELRVGIENTSPPRRGNFNLKDQPYSSVLDYFAACDDIVFTL